MLDTKFIVTPQTGFVLGTEFTVTNLTSGATIEQYTWDFGTGELQYNVTNPTFTYKYPKSYTITLTAIDIDGNTGTFSQDITADILYRDYIKFLQIPEKFSDPGKETEELFKIEVLTSNISNSLIVDLFAANSNSTPYQFIPEKWNFLTPTWKFLDKDRNFITSLSVVPTPIYQNNRVVALSGTAEFYYIDSSSSGDPTINCPILITATLQTSGFSNPEDSNIYPYSSYANNETVRAGVIWQVNNLFPNLLKVTGNYIDNIYSKQWQGVKIPVMVTAHSNRALILPEGEDSVSEVLFSYPSTNTLGNIAPLTLNLLNVPATGYTIDESPLYFQTTDKDNFKSGGYVFTTITCNTAVNITSIVASSVANSNLVPANNGFIDPSPYSPNTSVWVSNPEKNTLNKITLVPDPGNCNTIQYFKDRGILTDGIVKEVSVPSLSTNSTFNYTMSGFSGIYGMAVDPRNYDLIACDTELDRLYRISNTGEILNTFELTSLNDFNPKQKFLENWQWVTPSPLLSATTYVLYKPTPLSNNPKNYIVLVGGVIQSTDIIQIDDEYRTLRLNISPSYPPEDVEVNVMQIFNPALPNKYITSPYTFTATSSVPTTTFTLTGAPSLSSNPNYYLVSVDGVLQHPSTYTINNTNKTIKLGGPIPANTTLFVHYLPLILPPAEWTYSLTTQTNLLQLDNTTANYRNDPNSGFIISIGGVLQNTQNYTYNYITNTLNFNSTLPQGIPISVRQLSVPEDIETHAAYTPASISLDKNYNIWVSLFNSVSVLKFDKDFNLLFTTVPSGVNWVYRPETVFPIGIDYQSSQFDETPIHITPYDFKYDSFYNEFFLKPTVVETDRNNNCWATYSNPLCCLLVQYNSQGSAIKQIPLPPYTMPINMAINAQNNLWVSNFHGSTYSNVALSGSIQLYNTSNSTLLTTITGIARPGHIAVDRNNNLWFSHSVRKIGYYNTSTSRLSTWTLELTGGFTQYTLTSTELLSGMEQFDQQENEENDEIGGLAVDVYNRVWILDNLRNFAWVITASPNFETAPWRYFKIQPNATIGYHLDLDNSFTYTVSSDYYYFKSAQATGDWTGNKWYQKYANIQELAATAISGTSTPFSITEFVNNNQIRRLNESFNTSEYYKSLALPEILNSNTVLFDQFFAAAVGTGYLSANEDIGQVSYEKIANFVLNHADIDTCNIDQLLSLAEETGVAASDYSAVYPTDISNMIDIASVSRSKLWGMLDNTPIPLQSVGEQYNTLTDYVTAGTKIYLRNKYDNSLSLIPVPQEGPQLIYPLSSLSAYGFAPPVLANYLFYKYEPVYSGNYIENVIDWESPHTTQSPYLSSVQDWYGDEGAIETTFRYLLTKNLFLK